jgi:hypothetical protein
MWQWPPSTQTAVVEKMFGASGLFRERATIHKTETSSATLIAIGNR